MTVEHTTVSRTDASSPTHGHRRDTIDGICTTTRADENASTNTTVTRLSARRRLIVTITFFSMFFGASNLIFPPLLGAEAGKATVPAALGFICSAVGLPILGVIAVAHAGGFGNLASRVSPRFALILGTAIILTIGPLFAIPRTAATSFEMAVAPLTPTTSHPMAQLLYTLVFFTLSYVLSQHPEHLSGTIGRFMAPLLLVMIAMLVGICLFSTHGDFGAPSGIFAQGQLSQGFIEGYQTMDLLAALYFGIVISANITQLGVTDEQTNRREVAISGAGTGLLLAVIYAALAYVGMVSGSLQRIDPSTDTGATVLTNLTSHLLGKFGTAFVGLIFIIACFNVCTGLIATCASYFEQRFPRLLSLRMSYRSWSIVFVVSSFAIANAGLGTIITISVPVLSALYPLAIILVVFGMMHHAIEAYAPRMYFWTIPLVAAFTSVQCAISLLSVLGAPLSPARAAMDSLPLAEEQLTWLIPAALGMLLGIVDGLLRRYTTRSL